MGVQATMGNPCGVGSDWRVNCPFSFNCFHSTWQPSLAHHTCVLGDLSIGWSWCQGGRGWTSVAFSACGPHVPRGPCISLLTQRTICRACGWRRYAGLRMHIAAVGGGGGCVLCVCVRDLVWACAFLRCFKCICCLRYTCA
jgi:hypothetical protein